MIEPARTQYNHSVKVPIQYKTGSKVLRAHIEKHESLKSLVLQEKHAWRDRLMGLLSRIPKHKNDLELLMTECNLEENEPRLDKYLAMVMMTELLFGAGKLVGKSKPVECMLKYEPKFRELLAGNEWLVKAVEGETLQKKSAQVNKKPRYVRVNTVITTRAEAIEQFSEDGFIEVDTTDCKNYDDFLQVVGDLGEKEYVSDMHVNNLFVFSPLTSRHWALHTWVAERKLVLQDKASCLSAMLLDPPRGATVLDMCAAPGMKTTHLASFLKKKGMIYAVEKSQDRYKSLCKIVKESKCTNVVTTMCADATSLDSDDMPGVEYILIDPSCSGSGMTGNIFKSDKSEMTERLKGLSFYQTKMLTHAMTKFPDAQKIVYSTCSVYEEENEQVVAGALEECSDWELIKPMKFAEKWKHFGSPKYKHVGKQCFYARAEVDLSDGFFVAVFQRKPDGEVSQEAAPQLKKKTGPTKPEVHTVGKFVSILKTGNKEFVSKKKSTKSQPLKTNAQPLNTNAQPLKTNAQPLKTSAQPPKSKKRPVAESTTVPNKKSKK